MTGLCEGGNEPPVLQKPFFFDSTPEEIQWFGLEEILISILKSSFVIKLKRGTDLSFYEETSHHSVADRLPGSPDRYVRSQFYKTSQQLLAFEKCTVTELEKYQIEAGLYGLYWYAGVCMSVPMRCVPRLLLLVLTWRTAVCAIQLGLDEVRSAPTLRDVDTCGEIPNNINCKILQFSTLVQCLDERERFCLSRTEKGDQCLLARPS
ncbi:hypothetical protein ANN_24476 [Periplaneta americana]|uniref:Uncharacterized protein n=1 Tax=Periplaneta americana TaxID=6978 RepID=A0ABQ8S348_PERAM|nr:hypothetical protein ANN_24476 [Periplaneta americana]